MTELNGAAAEAMVAAGVDAATDVTGFGLLGHLRSCSRPRRAPPPWTPALVPAPPGASSWPGRASSPAERAATTSSSTIRRLGRAPARGAAGAGRRADLRRHADRDPRPGAPAERPPERGVPLRQVGRVVEGVPGADHRDRPRGAGLTGAGGRATRAPCCNSNGNPPVDRTPAGRARRNDVIELERSHYDEIVAHCQGDYPNEAAAWSRAKEGVAGAGDPHAQRRREPRRPTGSTPRSSSACSTRWTTRARRVGIFHSHTHSEAVSVGDRPPAGVLPRGPLPDPVARGPVRPGCGGSGSWTAR